MSRRQQSLSLFSPALLRVAHKELIQAVRDKRMLGIILVAPVLQTIIFGYAVNLDLAAQPAVAADLDRTGASREAVRAVEQADAFTVVGHALSHARAEEAVWRGEAAMALLIPSGFEAEVGRGEADLLLVLDGSDSNTALRASQEATQILNSRAIAEQRARLGQALLASGVSPDRFEQEVRVHSRAWFNPAMKTAVFLVPAVLALVLMVITMMLTSMGLTREKELGTLEQVMVTPIRPAELIVGKTLPFALMGLLDVGVIVSVAAVVFDLPVRGSLFDLFGASALFLMTTLGLGLFISTVSDSQQQAMMNAFFVVLPAIMLSGYIFPIENMPESVQLVTYLNPLRYYIELTRGIMVKGAGIGDLLPSTLALAGLGALLLTSAAIRFKKRVG